MKPSEPQHQLPLPLGGTSGYSGMVKTTRKANKRRGSQLVNLTLPISERRYLPVVGVPKTRADCPKDTYTKACQFIRCRWHLHLSDAEHRAGRPGLSNVPRDSRGWTLPVNGDLGDERAGTTATARWLELERRCHVWTERGDEGEFVTLHATYENEWEHFRERLHIGEPIDVMVDGKRVGGARMTPEGLGLDHQPAWFSATLQRVRGVPSCALDEIARLGKMSNEQTGDALGRHRTLIARELRNAVRKAIQNGENMGIDKEDLMRALMGMGQVR